MTAIDLRHLRLGGTLYGPLRMIGRWAAATTAVDAAVIYAPRGGSLYFRIASQREAVEVASDQIALLPVGIEHEVASDPYCKADVAVEDLLRTRPVRQNTLLTHHGAGESPIIDMWSTQSFWTGGTVDYLRAVAPQLIVMTPNPMLQRLCETIDLVGRDPSSATPVIVNHLVNALVAAFLSGPMHQTDLIRPWLDRGSGQRIADAARQAEMAPRTFVRRFADVAGAPPARFLRHQRLARAAAMVEEGGHSIADIARACGYRSATSFTKAFGKYYGSPPSGWRRAQKGASS